LRGNLNRTADDLVETGLKFSLAKLFNFNLDAAFLSKNKISFTDIQRANSQRYNFPIYTNPEYKKGAYKTFEEFKMNAPSVAEFEFKKGGLGDILYIKENNKEYPASDIWGFCDGKDFYINSGNKYSKLVKTGNSFYFSGIKSIRKRVFIDPMKATGIGFANNTNPRITEYDLNKKYYLVDMETGEFY
jgi:hypothetical protein